MLTIRSAAKVPPESWPDGGWELDPISSSSLTKLPGPNRVAGRFIVVFGLTLFTWVPLTTKLLNDDPAELKDELKAEACALATARTTSAVTSLGCCCPWSRCRTASCKRLVCRWVGWQPVASG